MVLDGFAFEPDLTAEDSAAVERLENGEGPLRFRMVYCEEVLFDEVVTSEEEMEEVFLSSMDEMMAMSDQAVESLQAMNPDSIAAAWMAQWEAMTPAERDEYRAEMERLLPLVADFVSILDDTVDLDRDALEELNEATRSAIGAEAVEAARKSACDAWRKMREQLRGKGPVGQGPER